MNDTITANPPPLPQVGYRVIISEPASWRHDDLEIQCVMLEPECVKLLKESEFPEPKPYRYSKPPTGSRTKSQRAARKLKRKNQRLNRK